MPMITLTRGQEESMYRAVGSLQKIADNLDLINKQLEELNKKLDKNTPEHENIKVLPNTYAFVDENDIIEALVNGVENNE